MVYLLLLKGHSVYQTLGNRVKESVSNVKPRIRALWPTRYWPATTMQVILDNFDIWHDTMIHWSEMTSMVVAEWMNSLVPFVCFNIYDMIHKWDQGINFWGAKLILSTLTDASVTSYYHAGHYISILSWTQFPMWFPSASFSLFKMSTP